MNSLSLIPMLRSFPAWQDPEGAEEEVTDEGMDRNVSEMGTVLNELAPCVSGPPSYIGPPTGIVGCIG